MTVAFRRTALRIGIALALSLLLHSPIMWLPGMEPPHKEMLLPPLTARLEPLPAATPKPVPQPVCKPAPKPRRISPEPVPEPASPPQPETPAAPAPEKYDETASATPEPAVETASAAVPVAEPAPGPASETPLEPAPQHPLPKHAQLDFFVYQGSNRSFMIGEVHHTLEISEGRYTLKSVTKTTGLAGLVKSYLLTQSSRGMAGINGLQPEIYEEEKTTSGSTQKINASFDWTAQSAHFSSGAEAELPADAQDILSMLYQLSQLSLRTEIVPLTIGNGKKLEKYELEVGRQEDIETPLGKLRALHLRKLYTRGQEGFEIWLGLEYRLLPVKFRHIDRSGEVDGEALVSSIRVADE